MIYLGGMAYLFFLLNLICYEEGCCFSLEVLSCCFSLGGLFVVASGLGISFILLAVRLFFLVCPSRFICVCLETLHARVVLSI